MFFVLEQAINDKILSLNYKDYTAEIKTADAQESHEKGVIVLVTGCLTGKDDVKKKFTQTFFLAPQEKGYFVLNDVFRFVGENEPMPNTSALANGIVESAPPALTAESGWDDVVEPGWHNILALTSFLFFSPFLYLSLSSVYTLGMQILNLQLKISPDPTQATDHLTVDPATSFEEEDLNNGSEVCDHSDKEDGSVIDIEVVEPVTDSTQNEILATINAAPASLEDAPKISYASIVS